METPVPRLRVTAAAPPPPARLLGSARSPRPLLTRRVHGRRRGHGAGAAAEALRAERARAGAAGAPPNGRQLRGPAPPPPPPRLSRLCRAPGGASPAVAPRDLEPRAAGPPRWRPGGGGARERGGAGAARAGARRPPRTRRAARPTPTPGGAPRTHAGGASPARGLGGAWGAARQDALGAGPDKGARGLPPTELPGRGSGGDGGAGRRARGRGAPRPVHPGGDHGRRQPRGALGDTPQRRRREIRFGPGLEEGTQLCFLIAGDCHGLSVAAALWTQPN